MPNLPISTETLTTLTCLPEKFIVDFANGIDVSRDHQRVLKEQSFVGRLFNTFNGKNARRQHEINQNITEGLDASLTWLSELSDSIAKSNLALAKVNDRVNLLMQDTAKIARFSAATRQQLEIFAQRTSEQLSSIEANIQRIDMEQQAKFHLDSVMTRWQAGVFNGLSIAGRCYAAIEELRWGDFGNLLRQSPDNKAIAFIELLQNKAIVQMASDLNTTATQRLDVKEWINLPRFQLKDGQDALAYLGDWSVSDSQPIVHSITQSSENMSLHMPRLCSSERLVNGLIDEVFEV